MTEATPPMFEELARVLATPVRRFDAEGRRRRIMAAAIIECGETGPGALSMAGTAARCGISTATLYRDFKDRDTLIAECARFFVPYFVQSQAALVDRMAHLDDPRERLVALLAAHGTALGSRAMANLLRMCLTQTGENRDVPVRMLRDARDVVQGFWRRELKTLEQAGLTGPVDAVLATNALLGAMERPGLLGNLVFDEAGLAAGGGWDALALHTADCFLRAHRPAPATG